MIDQVVVKKGDWEVVEVKCKRCGAVLGRHWYRVDTEDVQEKFEVFPACKHTKLYPKSVLMEQIDKELALLAPDVAQRIRKTIHRHYYCLGEWCYWYE